MNIQTISQLADQNLSGLPTGVHGQILEAERKHLPAEHPTTYTKSEISETFKKKTESYNWPNKDNYNNQL